MRPYLPRIEVGLRVVNRCATFAADYYRKWYTERTFIIGIPCAVWGYLDYIKQVKF